MSIRVLPAPPFVSLHGTSDVDSSGRFLLFDASFVAGANNTANNVPNHLARYDPVSDTWTSLSSATFAHPVQNYTDCFVGGQLVRSQGQLLATPFGTTPTVEVWNQSTNIWTSLPNLPSGFGGNGGMTWIANGVIYTGGVNPAGTGTPALFWKLVSGSWVSIASYAPFSNIGTSRRPNIDSSGKLWLFTGGSALGMQVYDPVANSWSNPSWVGAGAQMLITPADQLWNYGSRTFFRYDIATGATFSSTVAPTAAPTSGVIGYHPSLNQLFVFPGPLSGVPIYRYDIASDTWTATSDLITPRGLFQNPSCDGTGFYITTGNDTGNTPVNVVEYFVPSGTGNHWVSAGAAVPAAPTQIYATRTNTNVLSVSSDSGLTWTQRIISGLPATPQPSIFSMYAPAVGQIYLCQARGSGATDGIWRTLDDGLTWTRIVSFGLGLNQFGSQMAFGVHKLFYAVLTSIVAGSSTYTFTYQFQRCNLDGTLVETWATQAIIAPNASCMPMLRAMSDDFVLVALYSPGTLWRLDATGITNVLPSGLAYAWDAMPLTATQWLGVGNNATTLDVQVYRTADAGATWALTATIPRDLGFAKNGAPNSYLLINAPNPSVPAQVVMAGNAEPTVQQIYWVSADAGLTWTQLLNAADPPDVASGAGNWLVFGPAGLASVCFPAPVIPPAHIGGLVQIVG